MADGPPLSPLRRVQAEVLVVGASFAGCAAAIAAARRGARVALIERKADPGAKLHTTGILVHEVQTQHALLAGIPPALVRPIDTVRLYAPNLREIVLRAPGYHFLATDTPALMRWLVEQAGQSGVDVRLGCSYTSAQRQAGLWQVDGVGESRYLIGADGPQSRVAHSLTLGRNQRFLYGVEHELTGVALPDPNALHCFITRAHAPGYIGWALQGVSALQFGLAVPQAHAGSAAARLAGLRQHVQPLVDLRTATPCDVRAGLIPCGGPVSPLAAEGVLLVGDAAGLVSPLTAGGIHTAWKHAWEAGEAVAGFLHGRAGDPCDSKALQRYPRFRRKRALRWLYEHGQADVLFNALLGTRALRWAAERVYFRRARG